MNKMWLKEIDALTKAEVISEETAQRITRYYELRKPASSNNLTLNWLF
ncbi:MAG: hypothetical protein WKF97_10715 [Chitinophagaceae bacterium]